MKNIKSILSIAVATFCVIGYNQTVFAQAGIQADTLITHSSEARGGELAEEIKSQTPENDPDADHTHPYLTFDELKSNSVTLRGDSHGSEIISDEFINSADNEDAGEFDKGDSLQSYSTSLRGNSHAEEIKTDEIINSLKSEYNFHIPASKRHVLDK